jgi:TnpA family transposase
MEKAIADTDNTFLENQFVRIVNNEPVISKIEKIKYPEQKKEIEALISERLEPINILDVITDTDYWLKWTKHFGLLSGHESKMENPTARYILSTFCYGCNIGPTQTVRSLEELTRKHLSWTNQQHITEDKIDKAVFQLINAYNSLDLPRVWGSGKSSSTDGTKWDLYDKNLLSEYHIRYGGYGGIGYYHVSDKYIALFSRFIPCGTWEGVYLLDILQNNKSEIQPDTFHGDTQSQNGPIFGLSYLLGINLMPRIRNWKDLTLYRPSETKKYKHIDELFTNTIDWDLIEDNFDSMLRVALSIKEGKITPSTILKKLGTYSRKNKLYLAFRELGRAIRTIYLMKYISDVELRSTIQAATNKSEGFNGFAKWIAFGNDGVIRENSRDEQRKIIKYNHLVANCLIFYNACRLTQIIGELMLEGYEIEDETIASLSPYITHHINRFGKYKLDLDRKPPDIVYEFRNLKKI